MIYFGGCIKNVAKFLKTLSLSKCSKYKPYIMKFKKVDHSKTSFGFIAGLAVGIVVGVLFTQDKAGAIKEEQINKQTDLIKTDETWL